MTIDNINLSPLTPNQPLAIQLAKRELVSLVHNAVNLEGVMMTLPEVQTLLDGITIGGHQISDQNMTINQAKAWETLFAMVKNGEFRFDKTTACKIHAIAGKEEALEWGQFRTGFVTIAGSSYQPPSPNKLDDCWQQMSELVAKQTDSYDKAITACLQMARNQFFWDVNKRMGRFMMSGILLDMGLPIINVPAKRQIEFNQLMINFYDSNDMQPMNNFLKSCLDKRLLLNFYP